MWLVWYNNLDGLNTDKQLSHRTDNSLPPLIHEERIIHLKISSEPTYELTYSLAGKIPLYFYFNFLFKTTISYASTAYKFPARVDLYGNLVFRDEYFRG